MAARRTRKVEEAPEARLSFAAVLESVQVQPAKQKKDYSGRVEVSGGAIRVLATIERPKGPPKPFHMPDEAVQSDEATEVIENWTSEDWTNEALVLAAAFEAAKAEQEAQGDFEEPVQGEDEEDEAFESRYSKTESAWTRKKKALSNKCWQAERNRDSVKRYAEQLREHEEGMATIPGQLQAFGALAGMGALLQGAKVQIDLTPDQESVEQLLPGFHPLGLLGAGE